MELQLNHVSSPLGEMLLVTDEKGRVWSLDFASNVLHLASTLRERHGDIALHEGVASEATKRVIGKIDAYFKGDIAALEGVPVLDKASDFERRVWTALRKIPAGTTTTYGELAVSLGFTDPRMAKEVGAAIGANPVAVIVPCHRVIGKDGSLKGFRWGVERKRKLLELESRVRGFRLESQRPVAGA